MIQPHIEKINLLDTEYVDILMNSSSPGFEIRLIQLGVEPDEARLKTDFLTMLQHKPKTPSEWEKLLETWEKAYGYRPNTEHISRISKLIWEDTDDIISAVSVW
ncbi:MAG: hypothetical protein ACOC0N_02300 [Chroococcales cyanobacterium]